MKVEAQLLVSSLVLLVAGAAIPTSQAHAAKADNFSFAQLSLPTTQVYRDVVDPSVVNHIHHNSDTNVNNTGGDGGVDQHHNGFHHNNVDNTAVVASAIRANGREAKVFAA